MRHPDDAARLPTKEMNMYDLAAQNIRRLAVDHKRRCNESAYEDCNISLVTAAFGYRILLGGRDLTDDELKDFL